MAGAMAGLARKLSSCWCRCRSFSTRWRSAWSGPQARSRNAARSAGSTSSIASMKMVCSCIGTSPTVSVFGFCSLMRRLPAKCARKLKKKWQRLPLFFVPQFFPQPGPRIRPDLIGLAAGNAEQRRGFGVAASSEVPEFHELAGLGVGLRQPLQRFVQGQQPLGPLRAGNFRSLVLVGMAAAVLEALFSPGRLDENASDRLGGGGEKMSPAVPVLSPVTTGRAQVRFMHQGGGLERVARLLLGHLRRG